MAEKSYRDAIRDAMMEEMDRDPNVLIMGEDIGIYEGTFRITAGMLKKYGPKRVIDTPIAEAGMVGTAVGMAMLGLRPIVEMMTMNFSIVAADQIINHAAKVRYFSGGQVDVPIVIRGPHGVGVQLSAQHSQSFESFYGHFPGLHVVAPGTPADAKGMLKTAIRGKDPVIFLESAALYGMKGEVPDDPELTVPFGKSRVAREGKDVTIVSYGATLKIVMEAADLLATTGIDAEVIDVQTLLPFDLHGRIAESVKKTNRVAFIDEDVPGGASAFMMQQVLERDRAYEWLDSEPRTIAAKEHRPSYGSDGDYWSKPNRETIFAEVYALMHEAQPKKYPKFL